MDYDLYYSFMIKGKGEYVAQPLMFLPAFTYSKSRKETNKELKTIKHYSRVFFSR